MKLDIQARDIDRSHLLVDYTTRRIQEALHRFQRCIGDVEVMIGDTNGPRGGVDKYCRVHMRSPHVGTIVVTRNATNAYAAVNLAVRRARRNVANRLARQRANRKRAVLPWGAEAT